MTVNQHLNQAQDDSGDLMGISAYYFMRVHKGVGADLDVVVVGLVELVEDKDAAVQHVRHVVRRREPDMEMNRATIRPSVLDKQPATHFSPSITML
jgi:lipopolysaccharide biosynthesis regulator YciM